MKIDSLEKLYHDQMASLRSGEEEVLNFVPRLVGVATHFDLRNWIRGLIPHLREQIGRIEHFIPDNKITRQGNDSPGLRGLIVEGHLFLERTSDPDVIDAGLVILFQRILHNSMARYTALHTFAALLGKEEEAAAFQRSLDEQNVAETELTRLAMEAVNIDALSASAR